MSYTSNDRGALPVLLAVLAAVLVHVVGTAVYEANKPNEKYSRTVSASPSPAKSSAVSAATATPHATTTASTIFDVADLGVQFALPGSLSDLEYKVVHLAGDQSVNSVAFSSKRLEAAGCSLDTAPLGYLTYDADKSGAKVANARNSDLFYLRPQAGCHADASLQNWQTIQTSLASLVTDGKQDKTNR